MTIENVLDKYEYSKKDLIGHGAFAVVFKGKSDQVKWGASLLLLQWLSQQIIFEILFDYPNQDKNLDVKFWEKHP